jgi:hypothetical protein
MVSRVKLKMTTNIIRGNINRVLSFYISFQSLLMSTSYRYHTMIKSSVNITNNSKYFSLKPRNEVREVSFTYSDYKTDVSVRDC